MISPASPPGSPGGAAQQAPIASWAEEPNGELLMLCFDGRIYRMVLASE